MSHFEITIDPQAAEDIGQHALEAFPFECCGFLFGKDDGKRHAWLAHPVDNSKEGDQRRRFEISPLDYLRAEAYAATHDLQLLGVYHSHPNHPAIASEHDLAVALPYFSYVIVSVMNGKVADLKSWKLLDELREFREETVHLKPTRSPQPV
jgi:proteasome lid subunit RPN8/RPN11